MLQSITSEYILGSHGMRYVSGISRPDRIYISPELAAYFVQSSFTTWFSDHGALSATFRLPDGGASYWAWPLPAQIPWDDVQIDTWHSDLQPDKGFDPDGGYRNHHYLDPVGKAKSTSAPTRSAVLFCSGSANSVDFRAYYTLSKLAVKRLLTNSTVLKFGELFLLHGDFNHPSLNGGRHEDTSSKAALIAYQHMLLTLKLFNEHHARIFKTLKPARREPIDRLVEKKTATIIAVSSDGTQVLTDQPLSAAKHDSWWVDNVPAQITHITPDTFQVDSDLLLVPGQQLHQHIHITEDARIHEALSHFWTDRWSKHKDLPPEAWQRIFGFVQAFVPRSLIKLPDLDLSSWDQSLRRFKKHTARGADGYGRNDLVNMPDPLRQAQVDLFRCIENGGQWPQQLLTGFAHGIAKCDGAEEVAQFRPIIVLSMNYRNWASLRARQGLSRLSQLMDCPAFGFLPSREAQEIWLPLQAHIELHAQQNRSLVGCVADVEKAFNHLPRVPIKQIAKHVGFPSNFVEAWHRFLVGFSRRFCVHDTVGGPLFSNCGYPEGCPLSCLAMALVDWCYHLYQSHFSPRATSASFVDNLEIVANHPGALLHAVVTQDAFLEMFQLRIDLDKTYLWAVHPQHRQQLQLMGRRMSLKDKDLGGQMTYGARRRTAHHPDILAGLQPTWTLLKKLNVPTFNKHLVLYQALWPRVFHSAPIEDFSTANIKSLRTAAVRATGAGNILCDPGFFQLWQVVRTFRRILHKQASLIDTWAEFTASYDGRAFAGPFTVVNTLREGAFYLNSQKAKFDNFTASRDYLDSLKYKQIVFETYAQPGQTVHLFTDGSCTSPTNSGYILNAFNLVNFGCFTSPVMDALMNAKTQLMNGPSGGTGLLTEQPSSQISSGSPPS
ncbi:unnamed protein product [Effrenium voratum]|nr:unnamed protein product [Effrenium voratum]